MTVFKVKQYKNTLLLLFTHRETWALRIYLHLETLLTDFPQQPDWHFLFETRHKIKRDWELSLGACLSPRSMAGGAPKHLNTIQTHRSYTESAGLKFAFMVLQAQKFNHVREGISIPPELWDPHDTQLSKINSVRYASGTQIQTHGCIQLYIFLLQHSILWNHKSTADLPRAK